MMKKVAIIMGTYNSSNSIIPAIESILNQTYKNWEFIICDDGSVDGTYEILEKFKNKFPNQITLLKNKKNKGLTYTLNKCLNQINTEYVARMDSDDISHKNRLKMQVEFLDKHKEYDFVGTSINKFDENGIYKTCYFPEKPSKKNFLWNSPFVHPTVMIRTKCLKDVQGYRDIPMTKRCEDYDLWFRLYQKGYKGFNFQTPLFDYYEGKFSYSKRKFIYRLNEAKVRFYGYKGLHLMPLGLIFVLKPILVGLIPARLLHQIKNI